MSTNGAPQLSVRDLHVAYDRDIEILRGVNLTAEPGAITAVIGPNGAGKSTLLRALVGLAPVVRGRVALGACGTCDYCVSGWETRCGRDVTGVGARHLLDLGAVFVPQERTIFGEMTVEENLVIGGWARRRDRSWLRERIESVCEIFPALRERLGERAGNLSGGQQKILEIARGLVMAPSVLMLDEPTAGLSPPMAKQVYAEIEGLNRSLGVTILLVDQNVREALGLASHAYVLAMGRNDAEGSAADVLGRLDEIVRGWMRQAGSGLAGE